MRLPFTILLIAASTLAAGEAQGLGLRLPTPQEQAWEDAHVIRTERVFPNRFALQRLNRERQARGQRALTENELPLAQDGAELSGTTVRRERSVSAAFVNPAAAAANHVKAVGGAVTASPLPSAVDNSTQIWFPPVRTQGGIGSCASFSTTYYTMTYMVARALNRDVRSDAVNSDKFSPKFTYNLCNYGNDVGSWITTVFQVMVDCGVPTWETLPYDAWDYRSWPTSAAVWRSAIPWRMGEMSSTALIDTPAGLANLKQMLANGAIGNYSTFFLSWNNTVFKDDPATTADDAFVGQQVAAACTGLNGGHGMTVVGYNDDVWTDINGNGVVDAGEKGALKIVNSWGSGWGNGGFAWVAYDALGGQSKVAGVPFVPPPGHEPLFLYAQVYWIATRPVTPAVPSLLAELTINTDRRDQMTLYLGHGGTGDITPTTAFMGVSSLTGMGGPYAFDGSTTACNATIAVDLSDIADSGAMRRWFAGLSDWTTGNPTRLSGFRLTDAAGNQLAACSGTNPGGGLPLNLDPGIGYAWAEYQCPADTTPPASITDLRLDTASPSTVALKWTTPGDDGLAGRANGYDLRYSTAPITAANFAVATACTGLGQPLVAGGTSGWPINGLAAGTTYWFALKTRDEIPNWSGLSNVISVTTPSVLAVTTPSLPNAVLNAPYGATLAASGGTPPYTWSLPYVLTEDTTGTAALTPGIDMNWRGGTSAYWNYDYPSGFTFPTRTSISTSVRVFANGSLFIWGPNGVVYPFAASVCTDGAGEGIWVDGATDHVTIRWKGHQSGVTGHDGSLNFQATLYPDGDIRFTYGAISDLASSPYIGINLDSFYLTSVRNGRTDLAPGDTSHFDRLRLPAGLSLGSDGAISGSPTESGVFGVAFRATDANAAAQTANAILNLTVGTSGNVAPVISAATATPATVTLPAGTTVQCSASDADGDGLSYAWSTVSGPGSVSFGAASAASSSATFSTFGSYTLRVTVADGHGHSVWSNVAVTVNRAANNPPVANPQGVTTAEDTAKAITLAANDADGDPLTWIVVAQPAHGVLSGSAPNLTYTPSTNWNGSDLFTFKVNDGAADSNTATVSIAVTSANDAPTLAGPLANQTGVTGIPLSFSIPTGAFSDADGDPLTWSASGLPAWLGFNAATRTFSGTPGAAGTSTITVTVTDPTAASASGNFALVITAPGSGLVLHWKLDESSGSSAADASGQGNAGSVDGGTTWTGGKLNGALACNGTDGRAYRGNVSGLGSGNAPHTVAAWLKINALPGNRAWIMLLGNEGNGAHHWLLKNDGTTQFGVWAGLQTNPVIPIGGWHHLATTFDGATLRCYLDGVEVGSTAATFNLGGLPLSMAQAHNNEDGFNGSVDDVRIYDHALSLSEVQALAGPGSNHAPILAATIPGQNATVGSPFTFTVPAGTFSDADGDPLTYGASGLPAWLSFTAATRTFSGTPTAAGTSTITVTASDPSMSSASGTFAVTVTAPASGLVLHWKLDESSGSSAADASGRGNTGSVDGGTTWTSGKLNGALACNGSDGSAFRGNISGLGGGNAPHTVAAWLKINALPSNRAWIMLLGNEGNGAHHWLLNNDGTTQFGAWAGLQTNPVIPVGGWHHLATTFDGTTLRCYLDGVEIGNTAAAFSLNGVSLTVAQPHINENGFNGCVDDVRVYDHALTVSEVQSLAGPGSNHAPVLAVAIPGQDATVGTPFTFTVPAGAFTDADGDPLTYGASGLPAWLSFTAATRTFSGTPAVAGTSTITVTASDPSTANASGTFAVTVTAPASGLVLHWKLDENSGSSATDASGQGNSGTVDGGTAWTGGRVNGALACNGSDGRAFRGNVSGLGGGNAPHTLAAWLKINALPSNRAWIMLLGNEGLGAQHWLLKNDGSTQFGAWAGGQTFPVIPVGGWHHLATTFDGTTLRCYLDGVAVGSNAAAFSLNGVSLTVAQPHINENGFNGSVDDVRIYDHALSASEVQSLASMIASDPAPPQVASRSNRTTSTSSAGGGGCGAGAAIAMLGLALALRPRRRRG